MKYLPVAFLSFFILLIPLKTLAFSALFDSNVYRLKHSTFDPALRGDISEEWDYEKIRRSTFNPAFRGETSDELEENQLEQSTFDPKLRGEISEEWDYEKIKHSTFNPAYQGTTSDELDEKRLEQSSFNPDYQGVTSSGLDSAKNARLKQSTFNPLNQRIDSSSEADPQRTTRSIYKIIKQNFLGRTRTLRPLLPSIRTNFLSDRVNQIRDLYDN